MNLEFGEVCLEPIETCCRLFCSVGQAEADPDPRASRFFAQRIWVWGRHRNLKYWLLNDGFFLETEDGTYSRCLMIGIAR